MSKLTLKQQGFCLSYIETGNASEAYRINYDAENMKPETVKVKASQMLKKDNIRITLAELQQHHQDRHDITIDSLTERLTAVEQLALEAKNPSAAVAAIMGIAKVHGLITNKQEVTGRDNKPVEVELTGYDLARRVAYMLSQGDMGERKGDNHAST